MPSTCCNDVEDTGIFLLAGCVAGPAHDSAIVHLRHGRVREHGLRRSRPTTSSGSSVAGLGNVDRLGRVVEGPLETVGGRVRLNLTHHMCVLMACYAVHTLLVWSTDRLVCEQ